MESDNRHDQDKIDKARVGNHQAFRDLVEPYQAELQRHCYRMTGSFDDADDIVQETLFRAWRALGTYVSHGSFRAWLYRIATNRTLDLLGSASRRREVVNSADEPSWLQPYPSFVHEDSTGDEVVDYETVGLAFIVALQRLGARQRAVLLLCDVLGFTPAEAAEVLETTVPATNSLLQRARGSVAEAGPSESIAADDAAQQQLVRRFIEAWRSADTEALITLLDPSAHLTMPPHELEFLGADQIVELLLDPIRFADPADVLFVETKASGEAGLATYIRRPETNSAGRHCIMLFGGADSKASKVTGFTEDRIFDLLGLPKSLPIR